MLNNSCKLYMKRLPTYPLRSRRSIRSTQDVATQLCSLLWPPLLPRLDPGSSVHFRWFFAKLFLVFLLVFCLLVSILELSLELMICPFLRIAQAIRVVFVVSGLVEFVNFSKFVFVMVFGQNILQICLRQLWWKLESDFMSVLVTLHTVIQI